MLRIFTKVSKNTWIIRILFVRIKEQVNGTITPLGSTGVLDKWRKGLYFGEIIELDEMYNYAFC